MNDEVVYLTRRNLDALISKLDRAAAGEDTACAIIKRDNVHATYPQSMPEIRVVAVENEDYYVDRAPGTIDIRDQTLSTLSLVAQFFELLDKVECTDEGRDFHPNYISTCRVMDGAKFGEIMTELRRRIKCT